jgi:hypothetical protein
MIVVAEADDYVLHPRYAESFEVAYRPVEDL